MECFKPLTIFAAGLALAGCLVSDEPLFDGAGVSAAPLASGRYEACAEPIETDGPDCQMIDITQRDDGAYEFLAQDDDLIFARFHAISGPDYVVQFADDEGENYRYFWGQAKADTMTLVMIWCEELPANLRDAMKRDGLIAQEEGSSTCEALKPEAAILAAQAYRDGAATPDSSLKLTPAP
ncbi:MAG: hypothetical protein U5J99_10780 [Parvularculaceae bacterium]|nr:hypothetical protein [Parvularculaceae bacterium]